MLQEEELESFVKGLDDNVESVTTCLAETKGGEKEYGIVLTIKGVDVLLLQSDLEEIVGCLDRLPFVG